MAFHSLESHAAAEMNKERLSAFLKHRGECSTVAFFEGNISGEALSDSEFNEMLSHMAIRRSGIIDWKGYIRDLFESFM